MSGNARWMIGLGWGIPILVALAIVGLRPTVDAAGEHAGGMLLLVLVVPAFLLALALLTGGTVAGLRTWRMARQALGTADRALLVAGLIGALAGWYLVVRSSSARYCYPAVFAASPNVRWSRRSDRHQAVSRLALL